MRKKKKVENLKVAQASAPKVTLEEALATLPAFGEPPLASLTVETSVRRVEPGGSREWEPGVPKNERMGEFTEKCLDTSRLSRKWSSCLDRIYVYLMHLKPLSS